MFAPARFLLALTLLCGGCGPAGTPKVDTDAVDAFAAAGYHAPRHLGIRGVVVPWSTTDTSSSALLIRPDGDAKVPLVIYLPGLGQPAQRVPPWGRAWAEAGYAVLSIQPLDEDATAWSSALAHSGDFAAVAHRRFAPAPMASRLKQLAVALTALRREPGMATIDWSRVALAGFDLGAYTAMTIAGAQPSPLPVAIHAVIALSPVAAAGDAARSSLTSTVAALWISGRNDDDNYGLIAGAAVRRQAFDGLQAPSKFLAWLADGTHRQLGGELVAERPLDPLPPDLALGRNTSYAQEQRDEEAYLFGGDSQRALRESPDARQAYLATSSKLMTGRALGLVAVRAVSTAFLDGYLRDEPAARAWLTQDAERWLKPVAAWQGAGS